VSAQAGASQQPAAPASLHAATAADACPLCGAGLAPDQEWCLRCGAAARTRLAATPNWRAPIAALAAIAAVALGVLAAALVKLAGDSGPAPAPITRTVTTAAPAAAAPPATTPGATTPGTTTPGATTPGASTVPGAGTSTTPPASGQSSSGGTTSTGTGTTGTPTTKFGKGVLRSLNSNR
jgi:hypothetical protein